MAMKLSKLWLILICLSAAFTAAAQRNDPNTPDPQQRDNDIRIMAENDRRRSLESDNTIANMNAMFSTRRNQPNLPVKRKIPKYLNSIAVNQEDVNNYHEFLKSSIAGIVRMHDLLNCKRDRKKCLEGLSGQGSSYSFRDRIYVEKAFSDILFENSSFQMQGLNTLGFLVDLSNHPLETLTLEASGIKEMAEFEPSDNIAEVEKHLSIARNGFQVGNYIYKTSLPLRENTTYAFRSIVYRVVGKGLKTEKTENEKPSGSKRRDIIVIFRLIRKHEDGSISLLWKQLQDKESPTIEIEESK
jgi:hypothetical protein